MNKYTGKNLIKSLSVAMLTSFLVCGIADAASRTAAENKSSQFGAVLSDASGSSLEASESSFAEIVRKQRAAADARDSENAAKLNLQKTASTGKNACDTDLRKCMQTTCGNDFTKCALDGDTIFGDKLNRCRRETTCTGEEFKLFTIEIKADRDLNVKLSSYTSVIDCGNEYNKCIQNECGATFGKCLGKPAADRATNKCATIAKNCMEQDSGLAARFGKVIGRLRETAEKDVKTDEERMYKLRDLMRTQCERLGAMFDERSFDCVFTVNFFAGEDQSKPTASRKAYAGGSFVCMQEWFGINATTFKENAYRETRAQTAASSAMLGAGVGTAVGAITSGAIDRAIETKKAKKDLKEECKKQGGKLKNGECVKTKAKELEEEATSAVHNGKHQAEQQANQAVSTAEHQADQAVSTAVETANPTGVIEQTAPEIKPAGGTEAPAGGTETPAGGTEATPAGGTGTTPAGGTEATPAGGTEATPAGGAGTSTGGTETPAA